MQPYISVHSSVYTARVWVFVSAPNAVCKHVHRIGMTLEQRLAEEASTAEQYQVQSEDNDFLCAPSPKKQKLPGIIPTCIRFVHSHS